MTNVSSNASELWLQVPGFTDLTLTDVNVDDDGHSFTIRAVAAGLGGDATGWDHPQPVDVAVQRWMTDGAVAVTQGHENRSPFVNVIVSADTAADLAAGEAALALRSGQPCSLLWIPPSGRSEIAPTVFEVWTWHLEHTFDEMQERWLERSYGMRFTAKPSTRDENPTTVSAVTTSATPTVISIDTCDSTTGWTANMSSFWVSSGSLVETNPAYSTNGVRTFTLTRSGSVTGLSSTPYLRVDMTESGSHDNPSFSAIMDGTTLDLVTTVGTVRYFQIPSGVSSFSTLVLRLDVYIPATYTTTFSVADVSASSAIGGVGSTKQLTRHLDVGGSVKTSGSIQLASPSSTALGSCLVYTGPDQGSGYNPSLRQYRTSGNTVTGDASCVSGYHEALVNAGASAGTITYTIPASVYAEGTYVVIGRFIFGAATTMTATVTAGTQTINGTVSVLASTTGTFGVLGILGLPPRAVPGNSTASFTITLSATATASASVTVDELWVLDVSRGAVTLMLPDSSINYTRLWIDAPDADPIRNRPAVYIGTAADKSDAVAPIPASVLAIGDHDLAPRGATLFTVTDNVADAAASATFYRRWHTHAGN